jgi:hypothetical protein
MAFIFNDGSGTTLDIAPATVAALNYRFKELLKLAGWTHEASSDGTNVSNTSGNANDQIGSGEFANNNAWIVLSQPAIPVGIGAPGNRQIILRRGTIDGNGMLVYVPPNTDGTKQAKTANGTTTAIPTYTTRVAIVGTLPDTVASWGAVANVQFAIGADNAPPYNFYLGGWGVSNGTPNGRSLFLDHLVPGTYDPLDIDPCVIWQGTTGFKASVLSVMDATASPAWYTRYGLTGQAFIQGAMLTYNTIASILVPAGVGRGQYGTLKEGPLRLYYGYGGESGGAAQQNTQPSMIKGESSMFRWRMGGYPLGTLFTRVGAGDRCAVGDLIVPWDGSTVPAVTG